jgi:hypothetical protein
MMLTRIRAADRAGFVADERQSRRTCETSRCVAAEMGANLTAVDLGPGRTAVSIAAGHEHVCAILVRWEGRACPDTESGSA